jgi:hypothetical protein
MKITSLRRTGALVATLALAAGTLAATSTAASAADPRGVVNLNATAGGAGLPGAVLSLNQDVDNDGDSDVDLTVVTDANGRAKQAVRAGTYDARLIDGCNIYQSVDLGKVTIGANAEIAVSGAFTTLVSPAPTTICQRTVPKIVGAAKVGSPLTLTTAGSYTPANATVRVQWLSGAESIAGATGTSYTPTVSDVGNYVGVEVVVAAPGFTTRRFYGSANDVVVSGDYGFTAGPKVRGLPVLGKKLTAYAGRVNPASAVGYQWLRNGKPIAGATSRTYRVSKADYQKTLSTVITYKSYGYDTFTQVVKAPFAAKKKGKISARTSAGKRAAGIAVKVSPQASKKSKGRVLVYEGDKLLKRVSIRSSSVKLKVTGLKKGKHRLTIIYQGKKNAASTTKTVRVKK